MKKSVGPTPEEREMARILTLPRTLDPGPEDTEIESFERMNVEAFARGERLFPAQVAAVKAYEECGGGLYPISVGAGKTGICLMVAQAAVARGVQRVLWLMPVQLVQGILRRHVPEWRRRVPLSLTFHVMAGRTERSRRLLAASGAPGVYLFPYSLLSQPDALEVLQAIDPGLVVADEVHALKNPRAARTKRAMAVLPGRQFVGMSGTISSKGIQDYHHLAVAALGEGAPVPLSPSVAHRWGEVLDVGRGGYPDAATRSTLRPLLVWAREACPEEAGEFTDDVDGCRKAFQRRLVSAPGIVASGGLPGGTSLLVSNRDPRPPSDRLKSLVQQVAKFYETPDGEAIPHAMLTHKWLRELSAGFFYRLVWPTVEELGRHRSLDPGEAEVLLHYSQEHLKVQKEYNKALRDFFDDSPAGLDTPREVGWSISEHGGQFVGGELAALWHEVREADFPGRLDRVGVPVRVDDYKIQAAVEWAREVRKGILWTFHVETGQWLTEELKAAGLDPVHCPAGADELIESIGDPEQGGKGDRVVVASVRSHGTGRNLQALQDQIFVEVPRSATLAQQAVGRTHREGQTADLVTIYTLHSLDWDHECYASMLNDALYAHQKLGDPQRVILADYDPLPKTYPNSFLRERGHKPQPLEEHALEERFGVDFRLP